MEVHRSSMFYDVEKGQVSNAIVTEILAPVPEADDYSVSTELWQRLEAEIKSVSKRIDAGEDLVPEDVANVRKLKKEVDNYVTSFNKAMKSSQEKYKKMIEKRLMDIKYDSIEAFILKKRQEQTALQNERIAFKMGKLKEISDGLLERTQRLKDVPMAKELLPAFTARFPKIQSGAKDNDVNDWMPYFSIMLRTVTMIDAFFMDPKYEGAELLPLYSGTIRELLSYVKDGKNEHLANVIVKFKEDQHFIDEIKLKNSIKSKADAIAYIQKLLDETGDMNDISDAVKTIRTEQTWEKISLIVRLINS